MVAHSCNPSTQEAKAGGLRIWGQPGLHSEFQAILGYIARPRLKQKQTKEQDKMFSLWLIMNHKVVLTKNLKNFVYAI
jgi:hypothetical protein